MTRENCKAFIDIIRRALQDVQNGDASIAWAVRAIARGSADIFQQENHEFDREKFFAACIEDYEL